MTESYSNYMSGLKAFCNAYSLSCPSYSKESRGSGLLMEELGAEDAWRYYYDVVKQVQQRNSQRSSGYSGFNGFGLGYTPFASYAMLGGYNNSSGEDCYHIVPEDLLGGGVQFTDYNGHGTFTMIPRMDGHYEMSGPRSMFTMLGGRGEAAHIYSRMMDGNYFNDKA